MLPVFHDTKRWDAKLQDYLRTILTWGNDTIDKILSRLWNLIEIDFLPRSNSWELFFFFPKTSKIAQSWKDFVVVI